jgi:hypothetical protein
MLGVLDYQPLLFLYAFNNTHSLVERYSHASQHSQLFLLKLFVKYYFELMKFLELFLSRQHNRDNRDNRALPDLTLHADISLMLLDNLFTDAQA